MWSYSPEELEQSSEASVESQEFVRADKPRKMLRRRLNRLVRVADINSTHTVSLWHPGASASYWTTGDLLWEVCRLPPPPPSPCLLILDRNVTLGTNKEHKCSHGQARSVSRSRPGTSCDLVNWETRKATSGHICRENFSTPSCVMICLFLKKPSN